MSDYANQNSERAAERSRRSYAEKAEIGPLPEVENRERKEACRFDLKLFLETYFPQSTGLKPFSDDHERMIARLQRCILFGGKMVQAVYRGFAKTTIGENACLWATLYGHRLFIPLIGADNEAADGNLDSIKSELELNDLLYEDFPEACHPVRALEGKNQRASSQTLNGELTRLGWTAEEIVFPTIDGFEASGACIKPTSLLSCSRGMKHKMKSGRQVRPDFIFLDDPQTDESAAAPGQTDKRLSKLQRTVLKLAGHNTQLAAYMAATVIEADDLVDQLLDSSKHPEWQGERVKMVKSWSDNHEEFWMNRYAELRHSYNRDDPDDKRRAEREATLLYHDNREIADAGCDVSWEHCYDEDAEISAIQHAYNLLIDDGPDVFAAECQNEPPDRTQMGMDQVEPDDVIERAVGPERGVVPAWASRLTAFIDVQGNMLWYVVAAWADNFTGCIIDYGSHPDQKRTYFTKSDAKRTLARAKPGAGQEGQLRAGLDALAARLLASPWKCEDGTDRSIELCLVDEGYQTDLVYEFCRRSLHASRLMPAKGVAIGASNKPFEEYQRKSGETLGLHWRRVKVGGKPVRHCIHNPNWWKTFLWHRFKVQVGDPGCLQLYNGTRTHHQMIADHLASSEYPVRVEGQGRVVEEWKARPNRDNDLFDCAVGAAVGASMLGCDLDAGANRKRKKRRRRAQGDWAA